MNCQDVVEGTLMEDQEEVVVEEEQVVKEELKDWNELLWHLPAIRRVSTFNKHMISVTSYD